MPRSTRFICLALALFALVVLAYSNHWHNAFQFDDANGIVGNAAIRDPRNIPRFFVDPTTTSSIPQNQTYRPGVLVLHALDYAMAGRLEPFVFHRSIFISYLILGVLLYLLYARIATVSSDRPWLKILALCATGWYMLHSTNAETINYISQRADSLSTLMVVLGFVIYQYLPGWRRFYVYLVPMVLGFLVKVPALMFAPLLFFYCLLFEDETPDDQDTQASRRSPVLRALAVAGPALAVAALLLAFAAKMTPSYAIPSSIPRFKYLITQPFVILHYFDNFLLPLQLSVDTDWGPLASPVDDRLFAGGGFVLLLFGAAVYAARRREGRPIAFGIIWFLVALLPTSSVFPLDEVLNDHRTFFPYIGLVLAFSWGAGLLIARYESLFTRGFVPRLSLALLIGTLLLANAYGTYQRNRVWATPESLWYDATLKSPRNPRALMNYGLTQMAKGNYQVAEDYFNRALVLAPSYSYLHTNLGVLHAAINRPTDAERDFKNGIRFAPGNPEPYYYYAIWLKDQGRVDEARDQVAKALALSPGHINAQRLAARLDPAHLYATYLDESVTYYQSGDYQKSLSVAQWALAAKPDSDAAYNNICAAYNQLQAWDEAVEACSQALALNPDFELARNNLAVAQRYRH